MASKFQTMLECINEEIDAQMKDLEVRKSSLDAFHGSPETAKLPEPGQKDLEAAAAPVVPETAPVVEEPKAEEKVEEKSEEKKEEAPAAEPVK